MTPKKTNTLRLHALRAQRSIVHGSRTNHGLDGRSPVTLLLVSEPKRLLKNATFKQFRMVGSNTTKQGNNLSQPRRGTRTGFFQSSTRHFALNLVEIFWAPQKKLLHNTPSPKCFAYGQICPRPQKPFGGTSFFHHLSAVPPGSVPDFNTLLPRYQVTVQFCTQ